MRRTILLADDSVTIRKVVQLAFAETDYRVEAVGSGAEALERFEAIRPDLVLADVVMPEPGGYDLCRAVKDSAHPVPVLLLTGTFEPFDATRAAACGAEGHVVKPFDPKDLVDRVESVLARNEARAWSPAPAPVVAPPPLPVAEPAPVVAADPDDAIESIFRHLASGEEDAPPVPEPEPLAEPAVAVAEAPASRALLSEAEIEAIADAVVARLTDRVLREIAWDVVPDLAERVVRERLRELEKEGASES